MEGRFRLVCIKDAYSHSGYKSGLIRLLSMLDTLARYRYHYLGHISCNFPALEASIEFKVEV